MKKVYCDDCKYQDYSGHRGKVFIPGEEICLHPKNTKLIDMPCSQKKCHAQCEKVNKNNDCKFFQKHPTLIEVIKGWFQK